MHLPGNISVILHLWFADLDIWYFGACNENCQACLIVVHLGQKKNPYISKIALHTGNLQMTIYNATSYDILYISDIHVMNVQVSVTYQQKIKQTDLQNHKLGSGSYVGLLQFGSTSVIQNLLILSLFCCET